MNYENDIRIDETALDVEWLNQPRLAVKYGRHYAECFRRVQELDEEIKIVRSELVKEANETLDKPTGPNVEAYYRSHKRHKEVKQRWIEATYEMNIAETAKREISNARKSALENLVRLHGQSYFAGPSMPRDLPFEVQQAEQQKQADKGVAKKLSRTK